MASSSITPPDDVSVAEGFVRLKSEKRAYGGRDYTSGEIRTRDKFGQQYGLFEFRARLAPHARHVVSRVSHHGKRSVAAGN